MIRKDMKRIKFITKVIVIVLLLTGLKLLFDVYNLDILEVSPVITALVAGVIFTIAIIFTGTLSDYKESERLPGEVAVSIRSIYRDSRLVSERDTKLGEEIQLNIKKLVSSIISNLEREVWNLSEIDPIIEAIDNGINKYAQLGGAPPFIVRMRNSLTDIDRVSHRIKVIIDTTFIPAAYYIAIISTVAVLVIILLSDIQPYYVGMSLFGATAFVIISLLVLIKDMDNPFEGYVKIDFRILSELRKYLEIK